MVTARLPSQLRKQTSKGDQVASVIPTYVCVLYGRTHQPVLRPSCRFALSSPQREKAERRSSRGSVTHCASRSRSTTMKSAASIAQTGFTCLTRLSRYSWQLGYLGRHSNSPKTTREMTSVKTNRGCWDLEQPLLTIEDVAELLPLPVSWV
jgi:hypothetical protein